VIGICTAIAVAATGAAFDMVLALVLCRKHQVNDDSLISSRMRRLLGRSDSKIISLRNLHKVHKVQQEKLKEVKTRLNFEGCSRRNSKIQEESQYSKSRTPNIRREHGRRRRSRRSRNIFRTPEPNPSVFSRIRHDRSKSPRHKDPDRRTVLERLGRKEKGVFNRLGGKGRSVSTHSNDSRPQQHRNDQREAKSRPKFTFKNRSILE
ncbi:hypothetical protein Tco_0509736, partial [Tanacetum coccineum]